MATSTTRTKKPAPLLPEAAGQASSVRASSHSLLFVAFGVIIGLSLFLPLERSMEAVIARLTSPASPASPAQVATLPPPAFGGLPASAGSSVAMSASPSSAVSSVAGAGASDAFLRSPISVTSVLSGVFGGRTEQGFAVLKTSADVDALLAEIRARGGTTVADGGIAVWPGTMLVAIFAGRTQDASYAVDVTYAVQTERALEVHAVISHSDGSCVANPMPAAPYRIVSVPAIDLPLVVIREEVAKEC